MGLRDILSIKFSGRCKFCVTPDTPFLFCNEPTTTWPDGKDSVYCAEHHAVCYAGQGRDIKLIESMVNSFDKNVVRRASERTNTSPVDEQLRGRG